MTLVRVNTLETCATCGFMLLPGSKVAKTSDGKLHHRRCTNEAESMPDEEFLPVDESVPIGG
jgi:hypothetical protein